MIELGRGTATSAIAPQIFVARWADPATWPEWDKDVTWANLATPVALGARGSLKPASGPPLKFTVTGYDPEREFTDTGTLPGARLTFQHLAEQTETGTALLLRITIDGSTSRLFAKLLGAQFRTAAQTSLDALVAALEREHQGLR
jgi:hypothetical protein